MEVVKLSKRYNAPIIAIPDSSVARLPSFATTLLPKKLPMMLPRPMKISTLPISETVRSNLSASQVPRKLNTAKLPDWNTK
ncbi:hypothetical protein D3C71_1304360 [compost metagenome]